MGALDTSDGAPRKSGANSETAPTHVRLLGYGGPPMVNYALRATGHVAAWIVWHSMRVSLLDDLEAPAPPDGPEG